LARHGRWILAATILGSSLAFIDGTVVNVALPALQESLGATVTDVQWVVEAYALLFSALLLVGGSLGDRFGRRRVFGLGIALFAVASALCGLAPDVRVLIAARALQGVGAAMLVPGSLALIAASFPEQERGRAIGAWSGMSAMTAALGPALGGWLIDNAGWRWAFFLNLPLALVALAILFARVPESRDDGAAKHLDVLGAALATAGLGGLVFGLIESARLGWGHPAILGATLGGAIVLALFFVVEARQRFPMLPLALFRSRPFTAANLLTFTLYGALAVALFVLPLDLIQVQGYSATRAGAALLPFIGVMVVLSRWSGGLVDRLGARLPLVAGPAIAAAGFALLAVPGTSGSYWTTFFPALLVLGLGMAVTVAPLTTTVMNAVDVQHAGIASGVNNAVSRAAGLIAIAAVTIPMLGIFGAALDRRLAPPAVRAEIAQAVRAQTARLGNVMPPRTATPEERVVIERAVKESFVAGFRFVAWTAAALALMSAATAALMLRR
jgi:EmrB/QacA subfamily drug resistance transporter